MTPNRFYEGTLEEITAQYGSELRGRHLRILVDDDTTSGHVSTYASESAADWVKAFSEWISRHVGVEVHLPEVAISRESIYDGRG